VSESVSDFGIGTMIFSETLEKSGPGNGAGRGFFLPESLGNDQFQIVPIGPDKKAVYAVADVFTQAVG